MIRKTIIGFGFGIMWRIRMISNVVIRLLDLHNSSYHTQPHLIIALYEHAFSSHCSPYISIGAVRGFFLQVIKNLSYPIFFTLTTSMFEYIQ